MSHPDGEIAVRFDRKGGGKLKADITLPEGVMGVFVWEGKEFSLRSGRQKIEP
jgi:alpha-L-rhamnosidase